MKTYVERCHGRDIYSVGASFVIWSGCSKRRFSSLDGARAWAAENSLAGLNVINQF